MSKQFCNFFFEGGRVGVPFWRLCWHILYNTATVTVTYSYKITMKCFSSWIKKKTKTTWRQTLQGKGCSLYTVMRTQGVSRSDVTGFLCEDRSENRRSTAVKVSDHLLEGHIQLQTRTRQQVWSVFSCIYSIVIGKHEVSQSKPTMSYTFEFYS